MPHHLSLIIIVMCYIGGCLTDPTSLILNDNGNFMGLVRPNTIVFMAPNVLPNFF